MQFTRAVDAQADQEIVGLEKGGPLLVQERAVGLQGVADDAPGGRVFFLQRHRAAEEIEPYQGGLATLPAEPDLRRARRDLRRDIVAHIGLKDVVRHPELLFVRIETFLLQIVAVGTVQIAARPVGLAHHLEGARVRHPQPRIAENR